MAEQEPDETDGHDRAPWVEEAFDAIDMAAIVFDAQGRCVASNTRYDRTFLPADAPPRIGETIREIALRIGDTGRVALYPGMKRDEAAAASETAVRAFTRSLDTPMADGRILIGSSEPLRSGGYVVTFREAPKDRLGEHRALDLLDNAFESAEMGLLLWDAALTIQRANAAWGRLVAPAAAGASVRNHGLTFLARVRGIHGYNGRGPTDIDGLIAAAHTSPNQAEFSTHDGRRIQIATFPTGTSGVLATAIDVTAARNAETSAREMLEDAVEALGEGVALYDENHKLLLSNGVFRDLMFDGATAKDCPLAAPGAQLEDQLRSMMDNGRLKISSGEEADVLDALSAAMAKGASDVELPMLGGRTLEASYYHTKQGDHLVAIRDMTEKRRAEEARREADGMVRTIVDANPTAFLMCRVDNGEIIYMSPPTRERFGDATTTSSFYYDPEERAPFVEALSRRGQVDDYPVRLRGVDGRLIHGLMSARIVDYKGEKVVVSSMRDITDYLAMQKELERQRDAAHQNEKLSALGELLAGVAHELNNPLSVVLGYSMMLQEQVTDPAAARRVEEISKAADRCVRIVKTFLAMARQRPTETALVSLNDIVELAIEVAGAGMRSSGSEIDLLLAPDLPDVEADADQIVQVFSNIILNAEHALKGMGANGRLEIESASEGGKAIVSFADNGPGMTPDTRKRIFEPFYTTKEVGAGTGVGLAFCHRIITAHGGHIEVEDGDAGNKGARFIVTLALADPQADSGLSLNADAQKGATR